MQGMGEHGVLPCNVGILSQCVSFNRTSEKKEERKERQDRSGASGCFAPAGTRRSQDEPVRDEQVADG